MRRHVKGFSIGFRVEAFYWCLKRVASWRKKRQKAEKARLRHRFSDVTNSQIADIVDAAQPQGTKDATKFWVGVLFKLSQEKIFELNLDSCSASILNEILQLFYAGPRTKTGGVYKRASYLAARAAIQRELQGRSTFSQTMFSNKATSISTEF